MKCEWCGDVIVGSYYLVDGDMVCIDCVDHLPVDVDELGDYAEFIDVDETEFTFPSGDEVD